MELPPIHRLPEELLEKIANEIAPDPDKTVPVDARRFLSVESFGPPLEIAPSAVHDIGSFRLASKRFAAFGPPLLFNRVQARLSYQGLKRLEELATWCHITPYVKKFSYMVPYFYDDDPEEAQTLLPELEARFGRQNLDRFRRKIQEQKRIISDGYDARVLREALASFTNLDHIQLLRIHDDEDNALHAYLRQRDTAQAATPLRLEWGKACSHGSRTIGMALLASNAPCSWFSSPQLSPQSAQFLLHHTPSSFSTLAERLTCLTLHFDDGDDLDSKMTELSGLFKKIFTAAKGMKAVHVGFPSHRPLGLPLEEVFHNVKWDRLVAFGIQGWKLQADEIVGLALRHRDHLKGLRLRDVILKEGSSWTDVLVQLREKMRKLDWVSLRRIGYESGFNNRLQLIGAEVPDDLESDSESDHDEEYYDPFVGPSTWQPNSDFDADSFHDNDSESNRSFDSDDEHGGDAHNMDFPPLDSPVTSASVAWFECTCNGTDSPEVLGDDSDTVTNSRRKAWEKWVLKRCPEHGER
ncbi:hypothetical protein Q7P37_006780 [Cladosporium fusiforme]